ncbi:hypothetical protein AAFN86_16935 [Roseomonas sp. CAU 1739]
MKLLPFADDRALRGVTILLHFAARQALIPSSERQKRIFSLCGNLMADWEGNAARVGNTP